MLGQHLAALADIGHGASDLAGQATASVAQVDVESLRVVNGVIDVDAIEVLERAVRRHQCRPPADVGRARGVTLAVARGARSAIASTSWPTRSTSSSGRPTAP